MDHHLATPLPLRLACWFEARLHASDLAHSSLVRLYALEVLDPSGLDDGTPDAARVRFVAESYSIEHLRHRIDGDAVAYVTTRWVTPPASTLVRGRRPGAFPARRRARLVRVVDDSASATIARFDDALDIVVMAIAA